jgi:hypothetical protein
LIAEQASSKKMCQNTTGKADGWSGLAFPLEAMVMQGGDRALMKPIAQAVWDHVEIVFNKDNEYYTIAVGG